MGAEAAGQEPQPELEVGDRGPAHRLDSAPDVLRIQKRAVEAQQRPVSRKLDARAEPAVGASREFGQSAGQVMLRASTPMTKQHLRRTERGGIAPEAMVPAA